MGNFFLPMVLARASRWGSVLSHAISYISCRACSQSLPFQGHPLACCLLVCQIHWGARRWGLEDASPRLTVWRPQGKPLYRQGKRLLGNLHIRRCICFSAHMLYKQGTPRRSDAKHITLREDKSCIAAEVVQSSRDSEARFPAFAALAACRGQHARDTWTTLSKKSCALACREFEDTEIAMRRLVA